jgi:Guanylylate cyclase
MTLRKHKSSPAVQTIHFRQQHTWDCGLACVLMVLRTFCVHGVDASELYHSAATKSVWTIDLAHILRHYGCCVVFHTLTMGANPAFASEQFYQGQLTADRTRVDRLFREAAHAGIMLRHGSLSWQDLRDLVQCNDCLAIVLVDKWKLRAAGRCCCGLVEPSYAGARRDHAPAGLARLLTAQLQAPAWTSTK